MSLSSLLVRHQAKKEAPSRRPAFQDSTASCLQHPGGRWECAALRLLPYYVPSTLVSQPHGPLSQSSKSVPCPAFSSSLLRQKSEYEL